MKYFSNTYFSDLSGEVIEHRAKYGTANSVSNERGTDGKKNNTSEYNHQYYMKNKEKWKGEHKEYDENDKDFDESNYSEKNRLGDTDFYGWQKEDGSWVILEEDMKFTIPAGMSRADIIKKLEAFDKEVEAKRNSGQNYTNEDWINGAKRALSSGSDEKEFDVEAAARDVIAGKYKNGAERKAALGDDYAEVQKKVNELMNKKSSKKSSSKTTTKSTTKEQSNWDKTIAKYTGKGGSTATAKEKAETAAATAQAKGKRDTSYYKKQVKIKHFDENGAVVRYFDWR